MIDVVQVKDPYEIGKTLIADIIRKSANAVSRLSRPEDSYVIYELGLAAIGAIATMAALTVEQKVMMIREGTAALDKAVSDAARGQ